MTLEGAPYLNDEHLPVFDCATPCGKYGSRYIRPLAHVDMMAAAQPFVSGAISKTINLPQTATIGDVKEAYRYSLGAHDQSGRALSRRLEALAAAGRQLRSRRRLDRRRSRQRRRRSSTPLQIAEKIVYRYIAKRRSMPHRRSGYTQKAVDRRTQGLPAHRRVRRRHNSARSSSTCTRKARRSAR